MKRNLALVLAIAVAVAAAVFAGRSHRLGAPSPSPSPSPAPTAAPGTSAVADDGSLQRAIQSRAHDVPVEGHGSVVKLLADDREGSPHQRFVLRVAGGGTVLIAHNLELAPRLEPLALGDEVEFAGDYIWNEKGGVVHWTHPDPRGQHRAGWIRRVQAR